MRNAFVFTALLFAIVAQPAFAQQSAPLALAQAISTALANNPDYRMRFAAEEAARGRMRQARAALSPSVSLGDTYAYANPVASLRTPFGDLPFSPRATNVPLATVQYALYDPAASARAGAAAELVAQSAADEREARAAIVAQTTRAYVDLALRRSAAALARESVAVAERHERDARIRLRGGQAARADVLQAQTDAAERRVDEIDADNAVALAQTDLDAVMNVPLGTLHDPTDAFADTPPQMALDALVASARATRWELAAAGDAIAAARSTVAAASAARAPQVTMTASEGNVQPVLAPGYHSQFAFSLHAVWSLFDGGAASGREQEAAANLMQAQLELDRRSLDVERSVRDAFSRTTAARARVQAATSLVNTAAENERIAEIRYRGGVGTALELHDAALRTLVARQALIGAQATLAKTITDLRFAAGLL